MVNDQNRYSVWTPARSYTVTVEIAAQIVQIVTGSRLVIQAELIIKYRSFHLVTGSHSAVASTGVNANRLHWVYIQELNKR